MFNVNFTQNINNNDIITLYLTGENTNIYLCQASVFCTDNYSTIYIENEESGNYYNITINNLETPTNSLAILNDDEINLDYIKVIRETEQQNSETNYSYPESTFLETSNLELPTVNQNLTFSKNEN